MSESWFFNCYAKSEIILDSSWRYRCVNYNSPVLVHMHNNTAPINITGKTNELGKGVFYSAKIRSCKPTAHNSCKQSSTSGGSFTSDVQNENWNNTCTAIWKSKIFCIILKVFFPICSLLHKKCSYIVLSLRDSMATLTPSCLIPTVRLSKLNHINFY